ncbi:hypothetical protein Nmel_015934 [Mimus melanotis]
MPNAVRARPHPAAAPRVLPSGTRGGEGGEPATNSNMIIN